MKINTQNLYQYIVTSTTRLNYFLANNSSWSKMLFVVLIYSTCVYFTKLLNFFDYYNLLAGIPAGLAFAIFVIWGTRLWQSIWVGTFAVDLLHNLNQVHDTESITINIIAAFFTTSGTVLQALIAAYFTKPFIKNSKKFLNIVKILAFLLKIGPIACLISTTIDMVILYQFNVLRGNATMILWMSNYTLNVLGIFLLTPIVIFYSRPNVFLGDGWRRRISIIIFSLFGTASLLLAGLFLINHDADRQSHYTFKEKSNEISLHANNLIKASQNQLRSIGALIKSNDRLDLSEFTRFNRNIEAHKGNITFSWISNEDFNQQSGVFRHQLIYPEDHMDDLLGKDIAQHTPRQALLFSMKTGRLALAKSTDSNKQIWWLIYPVFAGNSPDANPIDTYKLLGFAAAQINARLFFEDLVSKADYLNSGLRITAMAGWNSSATILEHNVPAQLAPDLTYTVSRIFADEGLQIEIWSLHDSGLIWQTGPIVLLLFGIVLMMLIIAYSLNTMGYASYLERQISRRTRVLQLQNSKTHTLIENIKDVVFTMNENGIVQSVNSAITPVFGYTACEIIGSSISSLIPEKAERSENETKGQHKTGHFFPIQLITSEYSVNGTRFYSGVIHDVSQQKQLMLAVEMARDKAEAASQAKSEFLAAMSHEIRTPMNGVIGMLEILTQTSLKPDQTEIVELARESAIALLGIINDILDFSKIEAGKLQLTKEPFSIEKVTEKVCALLDRMADQNNVELLFFVDPKIPDQLQGDALRVRQILYNLVSNAIKFSGKLKRQGSVFVHIKLDSSSPGQTWLQCEVRDNGIGMSEEMQSHLFTAFQQGEATTTRRYGGTGLGLAISRQLALMMGGEISVRSKLNEGSAFFVRLPFPQSSLVKQNESKPLADLSCLTICSEDSLWYIANHLSHAGAHVQHAEGIDSIHVDEATLSGKPWVWLLDVKTGFHAESLRNMIDQYSQHNIRIVVLDRGKRRKPRQIGKNIFQVDANVLTRNILLHTVALAAGLVQDVGHANNNKSCKPITETTDWSCPL